MRLSSSLVKLLGHGSLLVLLIAVGAIAPATALDLHDDGQTGFCSTLDERTNRVDMELKQAQNEVRQAWQQQTEQLRVMGDEQRNSRTNLNETIDIQRAHNLRQLRRHADSAAGRQSVDAYKNTQAQAEANRRNTVSQADDSFTAAVKRLVNDRQATQAGQIEALRITLDDALRTASGQCAAGVEPANVARDFSAAVHTSRSMYLAQRKTDVVISAQVSSLSEIRRQATATANRTYTDTMSQARRVLQAHLETTG